MRKLKESECECACERKREKEKESFGNTIISIRAGRIARSDKERGVVDAIGIKSY